jgi:high affinity sulfate transporter 1
MDAGPRGQPDVRVSTVEPVAAASGIERWVPGVRVLRTYENPWLGKDLLAGVVLAAILVPQGMAYAELAGLPPVTGLYTTVACLLGYAVFGPSKILVLGPDSSISPMIFAALLPLLVAGDPHRAIVLAGMLAVIVGLIEIGMGIARLGFVADLLSNEVQVGYMNGLALVIIVGQLPKLFGFSTEADGFGPEVKAFFLGLGSTVGWALAIGLVVLAILLVLPRYTRTLPAVLVAIVLATVVSAVLDLHAHGVATVGTLPQGIPRPAVPWTKFSDIGPLMIAAVGITLVSLADTIATSSSFGARRGEEVDPNQEMIGIGAANVAAGCLQGFAVSTSGSRTAVVEQAGAKSQLASVVGSIVVIVLLLFFNSLLADLPQSALAAVLIGAALSLLDLRALVRYWKVRKSALALSVIASLGVIVLGVLQGIVIAIALAVAMYFRRGWQPHGAVLGRTPTTAEWHNVERYPDARQVPGVLVYRWEAPLFFANCSLFRTQLRQAMGSQDLSWVVIQCEAITDIDVSAAQMLEQLDRELNARGVHLAFVELRSRLQTLLRNYELFDQIDQQHIYPSLEAALVAIQDEGRTE